MDTVKLNTANWARSLLFLAPIMPHWISLPSALFAKTIHSDAVRISAHRCPPYVARAELWESYKTRSWELCCRRGVFGACHRRFGYEVICAVGNKKMVRFGRRDDMCGICRWKRDVSVIQANRRQVFAVGVTTSVMTGVFRYGWDRHIWDVEPDKYVGIVIIIIRLCLQSLTRFRGIRNVLCIRDMLGSRGFMRSPVLTLLLLSTHSSCPC